MIGQRIGNYQVTKLLAEGGMGAVYLAEHPAIGRKVAVKVLLPDVARDEEMVRRFFNEARAAHSIRHPGIVEILDFGILPSGASYLVMEFLDGESLAARLKRGGPLALENAVAIASQAADALGAAHAQGIVHRDLKPDNLFLVPSARAGGPDVVKVLDFGIAKLGRGPTGAGSFKTRTGVLMGTPVYMSPEQCLGTKEVDHRTDIYALGVILYEMLCGTPPFLSEGHGELIHMQISAPPPPPRATNPQISPRLESAILRALAKDPAQRFQSMADFQAALTTTPSSTWPTARAQPAPGVETPRASAAAGALPTHVGPRVPGTTLSASVSVVDREIAKLRRRRWGAPVAVTVALVAAGAAGAIAFNVFNTRRSGHGSSSVAETASSPVAPAATATAIAAAPAPPAGGGDPPGSARGHAESAAVPARISVNLTTQPSGARVLRERDGAVIGVTPFTGAWPAAEGTEHLRVEKPGYRPESIAVPLDRGSDLKLTLSHAPKPGRAPAHRLARPRPARGAEPVPL